MVPLGTLRHEKADKTWILALPINRIDVGAIGK